MESELKAHDENTGEGMTTIIPAHSDAAESLEQLKAQNEETRDAEVLFIVAAIF